MVRVVFKFVNKFCGFGDQLRGLITMLQLKQKLNFELIVDFNDHSISKFLTYHTQRLERNGVSILHYDDELEHHDKIEKFIRDKQNITFVTNAFPTIKLINNDMKNYLKNLLIHNDIFNNYYQSKTINLPPEYVLFHYRLGDKYLFNHDQSNNIDTYVEHFKLHKKIMLF